MTYAPKSYKEAQTYLCQRTGLPAVSVGLVGDAAHGTSGYHLGWDRVKLGKGLQDYSYRESSRDRSRISDGSSAIDLGWFSIRIGTRTVTLLNFNNWLVAECRAGAPDTSWIREVIYTTDRKTVRRWDRLGVRSSGDDSHLTHTHISGHRDAEDVPKKPLFERFFAAMAGGTTGSTSTPGEDMPLTQQDLVAIWTHDLVDGPGTGQAYKLINQLVGDVADLKARPAAEVAMTPADREAIVTGVVGGLVTNTAFLSAVAKAVADENARRQQA